jgi:adenylate kinase family enzyme
MQRISVVGCSGSGKTTAARAIAETLRYRCLELDSVYHLPDWVPLPDDEFRAVAREFALQDRWVIDGNYTSHGVLDVVWHYADTVVWLDPPRRTVMRRVTWRTLRRAVLREELWNGNREPWGNFTKWAPEENIVRWAWTTFDHTREKYEGRMNDPQWGHLDFVRLRSRGEVSEFVASLVPPSRGDSRRA